MRPSYPLAFRRTTVSLLAMLLTASLSSAAQDPPDLEIRAETSEGALEIELALSDVSAGPLAVGLAYDSRRLDFDGYTHLDDAGLLGRSARPGFDRRDLDAEPRTDRTLRLVWLDVDPTRDAAAPLARIRFRLTDDPAGNIAPAPSPPS